MSDCFTQANAAASAALTRFYELRECLLAAFAQTHNAMGVESRRNADGTHWCYPVAAAWGNEVTGELRQQAQPLADQYFAMCAIPPDDCLVAMRLVGFAWRVSYERRDLEWTT